MRSDSARCSRRGKLARRLVLVALFSLSASALRAQTIDPNVVEFVPPAEHWTTVDHYLLSFYQSGGTDAVLSLNLGKPAPQVDGMIRVDYNQMFGAWPLPNTQSEGRVSAVTAGGSAISDPSNAFVYTCNPTLSATAASFSAAGGPGSVQVTTGGHCGWTASSGTAWVGITAGASGVGSGTVGYTVAANTATTARSGALALAGLNHIVNEAGVVVNQPPTVQITSPATGSTTSKFISMSATASDADGTISKVEFRANGQLVKVFTAAPYSYKWKPGSGAYTLTATAYDNTNASTTTAAVSTTVR